MADEPEDESRSPAWRHIVFYPDRLRMSCQGAECMYKGRAVNVTRGARHIYNCAAARTAQPALIVDLERYNAARPPNERGSASRGQQGRR